MPLVSTTVAGTYVLPNDTAEHDVVELLNAAGSAKDFTIRFDLSAITKANFRLRLYFKINDSTYVLHTQNVFGIADDAGQFEEPLTAYSIKVTAQSTIAEGATRNVPYKYSLVPR